MTLTVSSGFAGIREIPRDGELDTEINKEKQRPQESHLPARQQRPGIVASWWRKTSTESHLGSLAA